MMNKLRTHFSSDSQHQTSVTCVQLKI